MKKWLIYVGSVLLILAFMVQMGWLEIIGIHRISFGGGSDGGHQYSGYTGLCQ